MSAKNQHPFVSVVVLNWNGLFDTEICLEHIRKSDYPNYEIVVVDNGSTDGSKDCLSKQSGIVYVDNPKNRGFTGGHIDGLANANGDYILLLNNDAVIQVDYITRAVEDLKDPKVGAVGGRAYFWNDESPLLDIKNPFYTYMNVDIYTGEAFMQSSDYGQKQTVNVVSGSAVMVRRSVIEQIGYLYNDFFAYFEETDLFARMKRAGYTVLYDPELHIWHRNGASSGASSGSHFFYYQIFRNRFIFAVRNFEPWFLRRFILHYYKIVLVSVLQILRDPANKTRHVAYAKAGAYNVFAFPKTFLSRKGIQKQLGRSNYNHQLSLEQTGLSVVVDATQTSSHEFTALVALLNQDTDPLHEYVLVGTASQKFPALKNSNARLIVDRDYFEATPLNLGCLASRYSWMLLCASAGAVPRELTAFQRASATTLGTGKEMIYLAPDKKSDPLILIHKQLFERMGGLGSRRDVITKNFQSILAYGQTANVLLLQYGHLNVPQLTKAQTLAIDQAVRLDNDLLKSRKSTVFKRLQSKYYRLFQVTALVRWLFMKNVPIRLKLARLKNFLVNMARLQFSAVALEIKHMSNEVIIYGGKHHAIERQKKVVAQSLVTAQKEPSNIPVFIICRDRLEPLLKLVSWLEQRGFKRIVFIDNDSLFPPLLDFYSQTPYQVIKLMRNVGHTSPWTLSLTRVLVPEEFYIVSDPDVIPAKECPADVIRYFLRVHQAYMAYQKVGFGLKIDDLPDTYPLKRQVVEWESQFWKQPLDNDLFEAGVDTTFALYKPFTYSYTLHPSIRTGGNYVARHLPWYGDPSKISADEQYYRYRANHAISSWNTDILKDRYAKEMTGK